MGAYLLITFDGDSMEALEPTIERAATLLLEESALDVLVADTPQKLKEAWAARSSFLEGSRNRPSSWTSATWWCP